MITYDPTNNWWNSYCILSPCSKFHNHFPSIFLPSRQTRAFDSVLECSILTILSPTTNDTSILGMKNLAQQEGEFAAINIHISPTLGIESTSSNNSIVNGLDKNRGKIIYMMMPINCNIAFCSMSYLQPQLNPHVHANMNNKQCQITYFC